MNATLYIYTLKRTIFKQNNDLPFQNENNDLPFFVLRHFDFRRKLTFPKECFNVIWLIVGDYEYIYITEIFLLLWDIRGETIFPRPLKCLWGAMDPPFGNFSVKYVIQHFDIVTGCKKFIHRTYNDREAPWCPGLKSFQPGELKSLCGPTNKWVPNSFQS